jgi:hypothetical protein
LPEVAPAGGCGLADYEDNFHLSSTPCKERIQTKTPSITVVA